MDLAGYTASLQETASGIAVVRSQEITKDFLDEIHNERGAKANIKRGEFDRVAAVPTSLVDLWLAQGVPFFDLTAREVVQRLERDSLHAFITTEGRV